MLTTATTPITKPATKLAISVIIPAKDESESLPELCEWIAKVMNENGWGGEPAAYEILIIDDGSRDNSWEVIRQLSEADPRIKGIQFNRNYGKSAALHTGFQAALGEVVITMDADLQDSPDEIPGLYRMIKDEKYDLVSGWKKKRYDPITKTLPTKLFNAVARGISGLTLHDFNCGLKAYNQRVVKSIDVYGELHRNIPMIAKWNGFTKIGEKEVQHRPRKYGVTKFGIERFLFGFLDMLSITFVSKFSKRPMHFFGSLGVLSFLFGTIFAIGILYKKVYELAHGLKARNATDQPLFFLALVAIIVGVQLFTAGFIGEIMTTNSRKTHEYLISDTIGMR
ncbi:MAG: glycosyltransferase family 2 protein [Bacteroidota bacterium]